MNRVMWANAATQANVRTLQERGIVVLGPDAGNQACGEVGDGRMLEAAELCDEVIAFFEPKRLAGNHHDVGVAIADVTPPA